MSRCCRQIRLTWPLPDIVYDKSVQCSLTTACLRQVYSVQTIAAQHFVMWLMTFDGVIICCLFGYQCWIMETETKNRTFCWKYHRRILKWTRAVESWAKWQGGSKGTRLRLWDSCMRRTYGKTASRYLSVVTPYLVDRGLLHEYTSRRRISRTMQWCKPFCWAFDLCGVISTDA